MSSPSLRGCGDVLTRRLLSLRADILARGETSYRVILPNGKILRLSFFRDVVTAFRVARSFGAKVCHVSTIRTLAGMSVHVNEVDWLLLPGSFLSMSYSKQSNALRSSNCFERSESAERSKRHV